LRDYDGIMKEELITFQSDGLRIEGLVARQSGDRGVVITHPHSLYGGTMYNQVVETLVRAYQGKGLTTLRFNFRGVGESQGRYSEGKGEKKDVISALGYLHDLNKSDVDLAGYSFGAWVNAHIPTHEFSVGDIIMVSPPVAFLDFSFLSRDQRIKAVVAGGRDEIAPADQISRLISAWNPAALLEIIDGADHFYSDKTDILESVLSRLIR
jgi:alpha/beta superfamily hydrolase